MQDIPQDTLNETTKAEQSAKVDLWEFDLTAIGGERYFFCNEPNEKGEPLTWQFPIFLVWLREWRRICKVSSARQ